MNDMASFVVICRKDAARVKPQAFGGLELLSDTLGSASILMSVAPVLMG